MRPDGGFGLAVLDPPWKFAAGMNKRHPGSKYRLMTLDEIEAMPIRQIMGKNSLLVLWTTHPMQHLAYGVLRAWGAKVVTGGVWVKRTRKGALGFGGGHWLRSASEPFILAKFGRPPVLAKNIRTVIEGPLREHSRKPDEAYAEFGKLVATDATKIEIFSRENRSGWDVYGDEAGKFDGS